MTDEIITEPGFPRPVNVEKVKAEGLRATISAKDEELPDTGVGLELERVLSPIFIKSEKYGTRSSTIVTVDKQNNVRFVEKTYFANSGRFSNRDFNIIITNK